MDRIINDEEIVKVFVNEAEDYIHHMKILINGGAYFGLREVKNRFELLLKMIEEKEYFPRNEIERLKREYENIADPRILQHLEDCGY